MSAQYSDAAAAAMESFQRQMQLVAQLQQQRARLTATVSVRDKRVTVTVNANNTVIETKFADDIDELSYEEIAAAVTEAAQKASEEVTRRANELAQPLLAERAARPKLSDILEGIPEFRMPEEPEVSTAAPGSAERAAFDAAEESAAEEAAMTFTDVEEYDHQRKSDRASEVSDSGW
ncbi:YbaB/EbfC family nucleoid-associated protein [Nocardia paucivorans]|uniref:YbaB/EbfC family nucleoid-associated protein n=1 Tax=Nocardia paucivorans TaxID=114259 RepID=UPI000300B76A|nr:YbaB/EbfC family nucleoid-associated protein [Nocardia paucivorans]